MKRIYLILLVPIFFSSCISNLATKASYAPLFDKQGESQIVGTLSPTSVQGDLKYAVMENIAVGINGNVSHKLGENYNLGGDYETRKNQFGGGEIGYFNHYKHLYFDIFGGYGKGYSKTTENLDYAYGYINNVLHSDLEQFDIQCDAAFKFLSPSRSGRTRYNAFGITLKYEYNKIDNSWTDSYQSSGIFTEHYVHERIGANIFFRTGGRKFQFEVCNGFITETGSQGIGSSGMFEPGYGIVSVNLIYNLSTLYQKDDVKHQN
jgi:hypothetical protein